MVATICIPKTKVPGTFGELAFVEMQRQLEEKKESTAATHIENNTSLKIVYRILLSRMLFVKHKIKGTVFY